jgi:hypothetical protein
MQALPVVESVVDGIRFQITMLDAVSARGLFFRLAQSVAPGLAKLAQVASADDESAVLSAIADTIVGLDVKLFDELCTVMSESTRIPSNDGSTVKLSAVFGGYFAGKYVLMIKWLVACLNANKFLDFLPGNLALGNAE